MFLACLAMASSFPTANELYRDHAGQGVHQQLRCGKLVRQRPAGGSADGRMGAGRKSGLAFPPLISNLAGQPRFFAETAKLFNKRSGAVAQNLGLPPDIASVLQKKAGVV